MITHRPLELMMLKMRELADLGASSEVLALACQATAEYGAWWTLAGRIAFRKAWAMGQQPRSRANSRAWELEYDELYNFARMGAVHVDKKWGLRHSVWDDPEYRANRPKRNKSNSALTGPERRALWMERQRNISKRAGEERQARRAALSSTRGATDT